jgi:alpha-1,3-mannosyltransferase
MRRKLTLLLQTACLLLGVLSLLYFASSSSFGFGRVKSFQWSLPSGNVSPNATSEHRNEETIMLRTDTQIKLEDETSKESNSKPHQPESRPVLKNGNSTLLEIAPSYIRAIMTPEDQAFSRLECPAPAGDRYDYLRDNSTSARPKYFFALDLHQCASLLPRLIGSIVETIRFLGPKSCALSVVEGHSDDGTFEILDLLREHVEGIGTRYFFESNELDPMADNGRDRIQALAELRNRAVRPLVDHPDQYSLDSTVVFINDVVLCMEDILELIHQRMYQNADMTCAMDWTYVGRDPTFYDVWIARGMNGDSFFNIPEDGSWDYAWNLFWNNPKAQEGLHAGRPFQVFSCWNGATAFTAEPMLEQKITFRSAHANECPAGEPKLFCKDMWHHGYGKIAVVPSINLEYSDEAATKIKSAKGYVSKWTNSDGDNTVKIEWETTPPPRIKCIPNYSNQTWVRWDYQLAEHNPGPG